MRIELICPNCECNNLRERKDDSFVCNRCGLDMNIENCKTKKIFTKDEKFIKEIEILVDKFMEREALIINDSKFDILEVSHDTEFNLRLDLHYRGDK